MLASSSVIGRWASIPHPPMTSSLPHDALPIGE
jgi:hypothetical protein